MSHIFISYSRRDLDFAQKIVDALAENKLDTAEIRNARGDPKGAAVWIDKALAADPGNEYYAKQKARFEEAAGALESAGTR